MPVALNDSKFTKKVVFLAIFSAFNILNRPCVLSMKPIILHPRDGTLKRLLFTLRGQRPKTSSISPFLKVSFQLKNTPYRYNLEPINHQSNGKLPFNYRQQRGHSDPWVHRKTFPVGARQVIRCWDWRDALRPVQFVFDVGAPHTFILLSNWIFSCWLFSRRLWL